MLVGLCRAHSGLWSLKATSSEGTMEIVGQERRPLLRAFHCLQGPCGVTLFPYLESKGLPEAAYNRKWRGTDTAKPAAIREAGGGSGPAYSNQGLCSQSGLRGEVVLSKGKPSWAAAVSSHARLSRDHVAIHVPGQEGAPGCHLHSRRCRWWLSFSISSSSVGSSRTSLNKSSTVI